MSATAPLPTIAVLVTPDSAASVAYGFVDMFRSAGRDWPTVVEGREGAQVLRPLTVAKQAGPLRVANDVVVDVASALEDCPVPDVVCVPEVLISPDGPLDGRYEAEIRWLRQCHGRGAIVAAACSGAMLLAEAGLLDGEDATTHWGWCDVMQRRHPRIRVRPQRALVISGEGQRLVMAGGGTSWTDLALYLIARLVDVEAAMRVARVWLIDWHHIGQRPFARLARARQADDAVIGRCQAWIAENYANQAPVGALVRLSGLPERSFQRRLNRSSSSPRSQRTQATPRLS